ncbi:bacteriocin immunity protein [Ohtaekwangia koreensis]|uniref:Colicin immunity protein / pyocin immunity protein n=1 Tax=Ohtaekwangia koreensis TaxID=688867 RepID=A0A1T5M7V7_9BACT|nr:bacteriocin immunity protein [Ohtaekwangia koreensis]SKC84330.1 Colicin immunity protein / pyocin immunity protein [Ohtaekwangia koreensis]
MTREELIQLVKEITSPKGKTEDEINELIDILEKNVRHPAVTDLIYFENLTAEEVIDKALNYKPFQL